VGGKTRADLIAMWLGVDHLFVDEVSMLGCYLILQIHEALVIVKGCHWGQRGSYPAGKLRVF